jgi:hypothetical protein
MVEIPLAAIPKGIIARLKVADRTIAEAEYVGAIK